MRHLAAVLALALLASAPAAVDAATNVAPKAYAPENLSQLNERDRIRVISLEYQEQSGGRQIPDDQLRFYLDQVRSGWTFSRIKEDIATSLRGNNGRPGNRPPAPNRPGNNPPPVRPGTNQVFRCESHNERPAECRTPFAGRAEVVRQLSRTQCVEGRNWGQRPGIVWVNRGCRAEFGPVRGGDRWENSDWGRYSVTCASRGERRSTCAWNESFGRPRLIEQQSREACIENRTWGYRDGNLWVDKGCRGRFGPVGRNW